MGKLSGCTPEAEDNITTEVDWEQCYGTQMLAAFKLLKNSDETQGQQALTIIGPLASNGKEWLEIASSPRVSKMHSLYLKKASMLFLDVAWAICLGFCSGPRDGPDGAIISYGSCFYVLTVTLPILEAATEGRVSVRRLWDLAMMKQHLDAYSHDCFPGVTYGTIEDYWDPEYPWMFGDISQEELVELNDKGGPEEIVEIIRSRRYWMWMLPDR